MRPRPASAPADVTTLVDDFEWPPKADDVSIHEIAAEPWRTARRPAPDGDVAVTVTVSIEDAAPAAPAPAPPPATPRLPIWRRNR
jgi:hypothetical protein